MKFCSRCRTENNDVAVYCNKCGEKFDLIPKQIPEYPNYPIHPSSVESYESQKKTHKIIVLGVIAIVVLIIVAGIGIYLSSQPSAEEKKLLGRWEKPADTIIDNHITLNFRLDGLDKVVDIKIPVFAQYTSHWRVENGLLYIDDPLGEEESLTYHFEGNDILVIDSQFRYYSNTPTTLYKVK